MYALVTLEPSVREAEIRLFIQCKADGLLSMVFVKAISLDISLGCVDIISDYSCIQKGTGLVNLKCHFKRKNDKFNYIIGKTAPTLGLLKLQDTFLSNVKSLIFDDMDMPIVYPRLRKLDISNNRDYVYNTNLRFEIETRLSDVLQRHNVFSDGKYSQLCHISAGNIGLNSLIPLSAEAYIRFVIRLIAPATRYLALSHYRFYDIDVIAANPYLENIQVLRLTKTTVTLSELFELVNLLPNMSKLAGTLVTVGLEPDSMKLCGLIDELCTQYYLLSHCLRHWESMIDYYEDNVSAAQTELGFVILYTTPHS
ncbi:hypothetical protein IW140_004245 [Coemansia sp. RSA 1813]|nr:hypothetical protein IW140_004245 [Coemansia sp. RSA 1813]